MATREEIKATILEAAGNPESGAIAELADAMAKAIWEIDNRSNPSKEVRVVNSKETR